MTKTFTQNDAIRYVYGDLTTSEKSDFEDAMMLNPALRNDVNELMLLQNDLDRAAIKPSQKIIDDIMNYAKSFNLHHKI